VATGVSIHHLRTQKHVASALHSKTKGDISLQSLALTLAKHASVLRIWPLSSSSTVVTSRKFKALPSASLFKALDLHPEQHHNHEAYQKDFPYAS